MGFICYFGNSLGIILETGYRYMHMAPVALLIDMRYGHPAVQIRVQYTNTLIHKRIVHY